MDFDLPRQAVADHWEDLEADLEATAAELEEAGWTTVALHPGDVTTRPPSSEIDVGLDVMVPGNEFEALETLVEDGASFTETAVYRSASGGVAFLLCVLKDPDLNAAALVPAFYPQRGDDAMALADHARETGSVRFLVRPLNRERVVTIAVDDPSLVFPDDWFG